MEVKYGVAQEKRRTESAGKRTELNGASLRIKIKRKGDTVTEHDTTKAYRRRGGTAGHSGLQHQMDTGSRPHAAPPPRQLSRYGRSAATENVCPWRKLTTAVQTVASYCTQPLRPMPIWKVRIVKVTEENCVFHYNNCNKK
jgi:hypothetical protein